jgi:O-antigen ligase
MSGSHSEKILLSRNRLKQLSKHYLLVILSGPVLATLANFFWPLTPVFKGQGAQILVPFVFLAAGFGLWIVYVTELTWPKITKVFLALVLAYWFYARILDSIQNDAVNYTAFILPIVICMIYLKPITTKTTLFTLDGLSILIIAISIVAQIAVKLDLVTPRTEFPHRLPFFPILGFDSRWEGVFGNVNYSGPVGAFLLVYGVGRGKLRGVVIAVAGLVFLLASESRGAIVAAFIGCLIIVIFKPTWGRWKLSLPVRLSVGSVLIFVPLIAAILSDPTGNGRLTIWADFISVSPRAPLFGVSEKQISAYLQQGDLSFFSTHGHNTFVQSLVTQGIFGLALLISLFVIGLVITIKAAHKHLVVGLAVFITALGCNIDEDLITGNYLSIQYAAIILSVMLTSTRCSNTDPVECFENECKRYKEENVL